MKSMNSEEIKSLVDAFGRLSFALETYVKLVQTGDMPQLREAALEAAKESATTVHQLITHE